jgi:Mn2+/Fe2+ NRAMP family transporter
VAESLQWPIGLGLKLAEARGFYSVVTVATLLGVAMNFTGIDPIKALVWSAILNGVISVPIMAVLMLMSRKSEVMGAFIVTRELHLLGWIATAVMAIAVVAMFALL